MGRVLLLSMAQLLVMAGEVVMVAVDGGSCRLSDLPLPLPFSGVDAIEHGGDVHPFSDRKLRLACSVQMTLRTPRGIAR